MKNKILMPFLIIALVFSSIVGCSTGCDNGEPRAKITNNGTGKASVQIKTNNGNTENINGVETGKTSEWRNYAAGSIEFTITIKDVPNPIVKTVAMSTCFEYHITIDAQNNVTPVSTERE